MSSTGPEHRKTRAPVIEALRILGWTERQLKWQPEWRVPARPSEATKREGGHGFQGYPVDLALFEDADAPMDWRNVVGIFEFKEPTLDEGVSQLETYLALEPRARFGVWTNGTKTATVWKLPDGTYKTVRTDDLRLPRPDDNFEQATSRALTWQDLAVPSEPALRASFEALLDLVVARDSIVTRSEMQLDQLCNMLLLKLESDTDALLAPTLPHSFQLRRTADETGEAIRAEFNSLVARRPEVFNEDHQPSLLFDDQTIHEIVYAWSGWNLLDVGPEAVSRAFQVFRRANLKAGEGQYFTPERVIRAAVRAMDIQTQDKIIDPACGTGGFLIEAFRQLSVRLSGDAAVVRWANRNVYGVDKDSINVKLTRAMMISLGDGSARVHIGDSIREKRWARDYPDLPTALRKGTFTVVLTNPPFGENLTLSKADCEANGYTLSAAAGAAKATKAEVSKADGGPVYRDLELGLAFLERSYVLLQRGGRLGIILPETYFFSSSYRYLHEWLKPRFAMRAVINIPMEAFQGFCRAKTNLYIMEKIR